jgi:soluble lytic murein transglycosylase-like protein
MNFKRLQLKNDQAWRRGDMRTLLRIPAVKALLVAVVGVQVVVVADRVERGEGHVATFELNPVTAQLPETAVAKAWTAKAIERESASLAQKYRQRGYQVSNQLAKQIFEAAIAHEVNPETAFGLVRAESSFRNQATSVVGAVGLAQLMPRTAAWMKPGVTRAQLRDPATNLDIGFKYLAYLLEKYDGNEDLALLAYNRGPGTVDRALRRGANPDNGYAAFVRGEQNHNHRLFTSR